MKFDGKGRKTLPALNCAFKDSLTKPVSVGTRVVGKFVNRAFFKTVVNQFLCAAVFFCSSLDIKTCIMTTF